MSNREGIVHAIDAAESALKAFADSVAAEPELGYREVKTSEKAERYLESLGLEVERGLALTGLRAVAHGGAGPGPTIAILAELDAVSCPEAPTADPVTGAAHQCGHNLQMAAMLGAATGLVKSGALEGLSGSVAFIACPAEEYGDLDFKLRLRREGKITFLCGKPELVKLGVFDDVALAMQVHASRHTPGNAVYPCSTSNGFIAKTVRYLGRASHAAEAPEEGVNALNAAMIGLTAVNALRETFREEDTVRVHPVLTRGGDAVNVVPSDVRLELFVRARTPQAIESVEGRVDAAFRAGGDAVGATTEIETMPGPLPLACDERLNAVFAEAVRAVDADCRVGAPVRFLASTDTGDISQLLPTIQPFVGGFEGGLHTPEFRCVDFRAAVLTPAKAFARAAVSLLGDNAKLARSIAAEHRAAFTREEYLRRQEALFRKG